MKPKVHLLLSTLSLLLVSCDQSYIVDVPEYVELTVEEFRAHANYMYENRKGDIKSFNRVETTWKLINYEILLENAWHRYLELYDYYGPDPDPKDVVNVYDIGSSGYVLDPAAIDGWCLPEDPDYAEIAFYKNSNDGSIKITRHFYSREVNFPSINAFSSVSICYNANNLRTRIIREGVQISSITITYPEVAVINFPIYYMSQTTYRFFWDPNYV